MARVFFAMISSAKSGLAKRTYSVYKTKILCFAALIVMLPCSARAACHAVTASGSGNHTGADWNNALANLPPTLTRGDIYYLADGSYGSYTFNQSGTTAVEIRKAQTYDHCTTVGWNAATMGSAQAIFATNRQFSILSAGLIINGNGQQTTQGCGGAVGNDPTAVLTTPTDCGIKIDNSASGATDGISDGGNAVPFTLKYVEYYGSGNATTENYLIRADNSPGATLQHMYIHRFGSVCVVVGGASNFVFTDNYVFRNQVTIGADPAHGQCLQSGGDSGNFTVARNVFRDLGGTAIIMSWVGSGIVESGPYIYYDNLIWNTPGYTPAFPSANGLLACINGFSCNGVTMSQNSIVGMPSGAQTGIDSETGGNFTVQNNIWYSDAVIGDMGTGGTFTEGHNSYLASGTLCPSGTANVCNSTASNPFANWAGGNFSLASDGSDWKGRVSLGSPYNVDAAGNTFTTDRGAFQFDDSSLQPPPNVTATIE